MRLYSRLGTVNANLSNQHGDAFCVEICTGPHSEMLQSFPIQIMLDHYVMMLIMKFSGIMQQVREKHKVLIAGRFVATKVDFVIRFSIAGWIFCFSQLVEGLRWIWNHIVCDIGCSTRQLHNSRLVQQGGFVKQLCVQTITATLSLLLCWFIQFSSIELKTRNTRHRTTWISRTLTPNRQRRATFKTCGVFCSTCSNHLHIKKNETSASEINNLTHTKLFLRHSLTCLSCFLLQNFESVSCCCPRQGQADVWHQRSQRCQFSTRCSYPLDCTSNTWNSVGSLMKNFKKVYKNTAAS